jgi:hypothetical protein
MHPIRHGAGMAMFYTGVSGLTPGGWPLQAVGLAYSDRTDGTDWRRHGTGPVVEADPRWYRTGERMGWRDPFVVRDDETDGWVMAVCASDARLPVEVSGCVAWATSDDLEHWTVHPPLDLTRRRGRVGVPGPGTPRRRQLAAARFHRGHPRLRGMDRAGLQGSVDPPWPAGPDRVVRPPVIAAPDGSRVVLHTTPRRVGLTDTGERCRGMLAQPKSLSYADGTAPPGVVARPGRLAR